MKKLLLILLMGFVVTASKAQKCNFSGVKLEKSGQQGQDWYFQTKMTLPLLLCIIGMMKRQSNITQPQREYSSMSLLIQVDTLYFQRTMTDVMT